MIGKTDQSPANDFRLQRFIACLLLDPKNLEAYRLNPTGTMTAAGLSDWQQQLLTEGTFQQICDASYTGGPGPIQEPEPIDGGGGSGGSGGTGGGG